MTKLDRNTFAHTHTHTHTPNDLCNWTWINVLPMYISISIFIYIYVYIYIYFFLDIAESNLKNHLLQAMSWSASDTLSQNALISSVLEHLISFTRGPFSSVAIATDYGLDAPGSSPSGDEVSACPDPPWGPPNLLQFGYRLFHSVRGCRGVVLTPTPI